ncbi:acyl-CoA dehydrogenase [Nocardia yunnanensis]|uniref:Acyl-CoA dehydrogenase n=1 Tax=Nocardia yunnanensis TaxID=2382165 RepID=A0A386ZED2_9NOCA|nr:acyl-CoA dehydrogenase family protein [Nocardia yunnanensis]AYF75474.1 acyl-CoA dehydrogenase [Nocardia yunnanensis]
MTTIAPALFDFTDEHHALRDMLRHWFAQAATDDDPPIAWQRLCGEAGIGELLFGGADGQPPGTPIDLAILAEESGAALYGGPVLSAAMTAALAETTGDAGWPAASALRTGHERPAAATALLGGPDVGALPGMDAAQRVSGRVEPIWDAAGASLLLCTAVVDSTVPGAADSASRTAVVVLCAGTGDVRLSARQGLDLSRSVGAAECAGADTDCALHGAAGREALAAMRARGRLVLAAEGLGVARCALDRTVEHARTRVQFGRTIGSFQAVKHRLADLAAQVELTRSAVYGAAWGLTTSPEKHSTAIDLAVASALAAEAAVTVTTAAVQLHGGMAITWEHWAHRYLRRARAVTALAGGAAWHRRRLAELLDSTDGDDLARGGGDEH